MKIRKSIYIEEDLFQYLEDCADINCRSVNQFIVMLLKEWVDADKIRGKEEEH